MIVIRLSGGLGNQMFQYAFGRHLSLKQGSELYLDLTNYAGDTPRRFALDCFKIKANFLPKKEVKKFLGKDLSTTRKLIRCLKRKPPDIDNPRVVREKYYHFDPEALKITNDSYLIGYWQTEKYFKEIEKVIRRDFTFIFSSDSFNLNLGQTLKKETAVSLHVRRGDYISNQTHAEYHGVCSLDYYREAIALITSQVADPVFYVFSDDPEWVKANIKLDDLACYVDHNQDKPHEDLRLMSMCKHHIVANSSFSWWGVWLNLNHDKIVIAPQKWFNDPTVDTSDLIPRSWVRI